MYEYEHTVAADAALTNRVIVTGPGAGKAGPMITGGVPETMQRLADLASTLGRG